MTPRQRIALGAAIGVATWSLFVLAIDSAYESQTLAGGVRLSESAILYVGAFAALLGGWIGSFNR